MNTTKLAVAIDGGFGNTKIAWSALDGHIHVAHFPSVVGLGQADLGLLHVGLNGRHRQVKPFTVEFNPPLSSQERGPGGEVRYLVGPNVHRFTRASERLDFRRLHEGPEVRVLTYAAWAMAFEPEQEIELSILHGFPVEILQDRSRGLAALAGLRAWQLGRHEFRVDGRPYAVTVAAIKAMAQPLGSYFSWGLNEAGDWSRPEADFNAPAAVADIGFNTLDLFGIEHGQVVSRLTGGQALGMHRAATAVRRYARRHHEIDLSLGQADELIRDHLKNRPALLHHPAGAVEINSQIQQALDECFAAINEFLREHWQTGGFRYLILTGGGAQALRQSLLRHYPSAILLPDPVTANANGLARYARRLFKFKTMSIS